MYKLTAPRRRFYTATCIVLFACMFFFLISFIGHKTTAAPQKSVAANVLPAKTVRPHRTGISTVSVGKDFTFGLNYSKANRSTPHLTAVHKRFRRCETIWRNRPHRWRLTSMPTGMPI